MPDLHILRKSDNSGERNMFWHIIEEPSVEMECSFLSTNCPGIAVTQQWQEPQRSQRTCIYILVECKKERRQGGWQIQEVGNSYGMSGVMEVWTERREQVTAAQGDQQSQPRGERVSWPTKWSGQVLLRGREWSRVEGGEGVCRVDATKKNILDWQNS